MQILYGNVSLIIPAGWFVRALVIFSNSIVCQKVKAARVGGNINGVRIVLRLCLRLNGLEVRRLAFPLTIAQPFSYNG